MNKKSLVLLIPTLHPGGGERVFSYLCKHMDKNRFNVTLCLLSKEGAFLTLVEKARGFELHGLKVSRVRYAVVPVVRYLQKKKPDIVLSTSGHLNALLGFLLPILPNKTVFIAREVSIVSKENYNWPIKIFYRYCYKNFDRIISQSDDMSKDLKRIIGLKDDSKLVKINNLVDLNEISNRTSNTKNPFENDKINLLAAGRLVHQKGFDLLARSFSGFKNLEKYHLSIAGAGKLKGRISDLIEELKIGQHVSLLGFVENPYPYMSHADLFISSSRYEGFPNAVLEALACGTRVVSNNYPGGINEIIDNPLFGRIIDIKNGGLFERTCEEMIRQDFDKTELKARIEEKYGIRKIIAQYENLLDSS